MRGGGKGNNLYFPNAEFILYYFNYYFDPNFFLIIFLYYTQMSKDDK